MTIPRRHLLLSAMAAAALPVGRLFEVLTAAEPGPFQGPPPIAPAAPSATALKFAIIGDMGNGSRRQRQTAQAMWNVRARFPYTFVLTVGDNMYGGQSPADYVRKFEAPYQPILDANIPFYASLGNHDQDAQVSYPLFNMSGQRFYTYTKGPAQFFALDSVSVTQAQLAWLEDELRKSTAAWKIAHFHHPIYSSGLRHGPTLVLRSVLEPLFSTYGVQVVFAGHEHFYERLVPQFGIQQFISGSGGQLRYGGIRKGSATMAAGFDTDNVFLLASIDGDTMSYEAIARTGAVIDRGEVSRLAQPAFTASMRTDHALIARPARLQ